jgi:hypothetical protein
MLIQTRRLGSWWLTDTQTIVRALDPKRHPADFKCFVNRPISVYHSPRRTLTLCPQLCTGIQPGARFPARSADALPATVYGHFTEATYRNRPIAVDRGRILGLNNPLALSPSVEWWITASHSPEQGLTLVPISALVELFCPPCNPT